MDDMTPLWIASAAAASFFFAKVYAPAEKGMHVGWLSGGVILSLAALIGMFSVA